MSIYMYLRVLTRISYLFYHMYKRTSTYHSHTIADRSHTDTDRFLYENHTLLMKF